MLSREAAQELIQVMKEILNTGKFEIPKRGQMASLRLRSVQSTKDTFDVYVNRKARINPDKYTLLLTHPAEGLLRIDVAGPDHENPDGSIVPCPHIHMRVKDAGKWDAIAEPLPAVFGDAKDVLRTVEEFLVYCHTNNISSIVLSMQEEV